MSVQAIACSTGLPKKLEPTHVPILGTQSDRAARGVANCGAYFECAPRGKCVHQLSVHWWRAIAPLEILGHLLRGKRVNTYSDRRGKGVHELSVQLWRAVLSSEILGHLLLRKRVTTDSNTDGEAGHQLTVHLWRAIASLAILGHLLRRKMMSTYSNTRGKAVRQVSVR